MKDGFEELIERAIRMKRYELINVIAEEKEQAEREYFEAIMKRKYRCRKVM